MYGCIACMSVCMYVRVYGFVCLYVRDCMNVLQSVRIYQNKQHSQVSVILAVLYIKA